MGVKVYIEIKKREVEFDMYPLYIDTTDENVGVRYKVLMHRLVKLHVLMVLKRTQILLTWWNQKLVIRVIYKKWR